jgi:hypothetical protein
MLPNSTTRAQLPGRGQGRLIGSFITGSGRPSPLFQVPTEELQGLPSFLGLSPSAVSALKKTQSPSSINFKSSSIHQSAIIATTSDPVVEKCVPEALPVMGGRRGRRPAVEGEDVGSFGCHYWVSYQPRRHRRTSRAERGRAVGFTDRQQSCSSRSAAALTLIRRQDRCSNGRAKRRPVAVLAAPTEEAPVSEGGRKDGVGGEKKRMGGVLVRSWRCCCR